eukprot:TRINITY_DN21894_c0_g1_i4.p3 TRINITY_DN21894_c0_g1~~TRINITY_DN21894_c0_g1_i4.p3  ORF type:complete len:120 (-),score=7.38 TRINITY_DN21894_c0_g1_i4:1-360(-)
MENQTFSKSQKPNKLFLKLQQNKFFTVTFTTNYFATKRSSTNKPHTTPQFASPKFPQAATTNSQHSISVPYPIYTQHTNYPTTRLTISQASVLTRSQSSAVHMIPVTPPGVTARIAQTT